MHAQPSPVMTMSLSSVAGAFNSTTTLRGKHCNTSRPYTGASILKADCVTASPGIWSGSRKSVKYNRRGPLLLLASDNNQVAADTKSKDSDEKTLANDDDQLLAAKTPSLNSLPGNIQLKSTAKDDLGTKTPKQSNASMPPSDVAKKTISSPKTQTRASLTAREKLRAARVLSRYPDSKPSKTELGNKVLDALRESDGRGRKKTGLPEAPTNMLDDSRRGMPKQGLTFDFPGGVDLLIIVTSTIVISTLMFGTAYVVWKAGAIHFNDL